MEQVEKIRMSLDRVIKMSNDEELAQLEAALLTILYVKSGELHNGNTVIGVELKEKKIFCVYKKSR